MTDTVELASVPLTLLRRTELAELLASWAADTQSSPRVAFPIYADCVSRARRDPVYRSTLADSDLNYIDGMGVLLALRAAGIPGRSLEKSTTTDLIHDLAPRLAQRGLSVFLLGARPGVARNAAERLRESYPTLKVVGTMHGYFSEVQTTEVIERVNASGANVLIVCLGVPREAVWTACHRQVLRVNLIMTGGGLFDFLSGRIRRGPQWMTQHGLEWMFRLAVEPRRLWRRYLIGNPIFIAETIHEIALRRLNRVRELRSSGS